MLYEFQFNNLLAFLFNIKLIIDLPGVEVAGGHIASAKPICAPFSSRMIYVIFININAFNISIRTDLKCDIDT